jgi:hypothetical protein
MLHIVVGKRVGVRPVFHPPLLHASDPNKGTTRRLRLLESSEARIGTLVGVVDGAKRPGQGRIGTVEKTYGHPDYLAMDVRFQDGSVELYWYHELRRMEGSPLP